jgi:uncharacterized protein YbjT (DUF2867 family)
MRPLVAVIDATGLLGGSVARAILNDPGQRFELRALVRETTSPAAMALAALGAELVVTDFDDATSVLRGFRGANAVFAVTNFWEHGSPERELSQARSMATAARLADVEHVVWSTQPDTRRFIDEGDRRFPTLMQRYKTPPFDAKGESDQFFAASGVKVTYVQTALLWERLVEFGMTPRRGRDGSLRLTMPVGEGALPWIAAADVGHAVLKLFSFGAPNEARVVPLVGALLSGSELAAALERALGEPVSYDDLPLELLEARPLPGSEELASVWRECIAVGR